MKRKQKRSRKIQLSVMGVAGATVITACSDGGITQPDVPVFTSVEQCAADPGFSIDECQAGMQFALKQQYMDGASPRFVDESSCESQFGAGQCHSMQQSGNNSIWMPLLGGFLLGQLLDRGRDYHYYSYGGGYSGGVWTSSRAGSPGYSTRSHYPPRNLPSSKTATIPKPSKAHTKAITRGGFGSRASSYSSRGGYSFGG